MPETFQLPSDYGLTVSQMALGNVRVPHRGGIDEFGKFDTTLPRYILTLNFTGVREQYGSYPDDLGTLLPELPYLYGFYERHCAAGRKIFIVTGIVKGNDDMVDRLYTFVDDQMDMQGFQWRVWAGTVKMIQYGAGDYGIANLPNPMMI